MNDHPIAKLTFHMKKNIKKNILKANFALQCSAVLFCPTRVHWTLIKKKKRQKISLKFGKKILKCDFKKKIHEIYIINGASSEARLNKWKPLLNKRLLTLIAVLFAIRKARLDIESIESVKRDAAKYLQVDRYPQPMHRNRSPRLTQNK